MIISIVGVGRLGKCIAMGVKEKHLLILYDLDVSKIKHCEELKVGKRAANINKAIKGDIIFFALPPEAIIQILDKHYSSIPDSTLLVNLSTFLTQEELERKYKNNNILSCKIIGEADEIEKGNKITCIINKMKNKQSDKNKVVEQIMLRLGTVVYDNEKHYLDVNYLAAEAAMNGVLELAEKLKNKGLSKSVIETAIRNTFIATAKQFPFEQPDYFHKLIFSNHSNLDTIRINYLAVNAINE